MRVWTIQAHQDVEGNFHGRYHFVPRTSVWIRNLCVQRRLACGYNIFSLTELPLEQIMDVLHLEEIPVKHIVKQWTQGRERHSTPAPDSVPEGPLS